MESPASSQTPAAGLPFPIIAPASKTVLRKNLIIVVMCVTFLCWFAYDGWHRYPANDDAIVKVLRDAPETSRENAPAVTAWRGWAEEADETRRRMDDIVKAESGRVHVEGWKSAFDIAIQRDIVYGLIVVSSASIWWLVHCQRRRAIAEETTVSPAPGVVIPWQNIKVVDNTRWRSMGIVDITYADEKGSSQHAKFDDYLLEREPLLAILDQLEAKAVHAEFIPKETSENAPPA